MGVPLPFGLFCLHQNFLQPYIINDLILSEFILIFRTLFWLPECSTTESSDDIEKQDMEEVSEEDEISYYDTTEYFTEPGLRRGSGELDAGNKAKETCMECIDVDKTQPDKAIPNSRNPRIVRREKLPDPVEKEKGVSLWSIIKDNVGKDLTRVCLPVYFNEPISSLQKGCEDLEYSYLLDQAYEYGKSVRFTSFSGFCH